MLFWKKKKKKTRVSDEALKIKRSQGSYVESVEGYLVGDCKVGEVSWKDEKL